MRKHFVVKSSKSLPKNKKTFKVFASRNYAVGDFVEYDSNFRGVNPKIGQGKIVQIKRGLAGHGDPTPNDIYVIDDGEYKFSLDAPAILRKIKASTEYRVGDVVEYDSNIRGVNPKIGQGTIVQIKPGLAGHGDPNPDPQYIIDTGDHKVTLNKMAILKKIESSCNPNCKSSGKSNPVNGSSFRPNGERYTEMQSKQVHDSDGFLTDYTMYFDWDTETFIFIFGDNEVYTPENTDPDYECQDPDEAEEWFDSYGGEDDIYSSTDVNASFALVDTLEEIADSIWNIDTVDNFRWNKDHSRCTFTLNTDRNVEFELFQQGDEYVWHPNNPGYSIIHSSDYDYVEDFIDSISWEIEMPFAVGASTDIKSARGIKQKTMSWDEFCKYQYKFQAEPKGMPNPTFSDDVLSVANRNNCIRVLYNGNRIGYFCQDAADYDKFVESIENNKILKDYIKIRPLQESDINSIESKLLERWNSAVAKFGAGKKIPKWRQKDMIQNRPRIMIEDYNQGSIAVYLPDEMYSFDAVESSTNISASEKGFIRTYCDNCGAENRVEVVFPDATSPFEDTTYVCPECNAENALTDPHVYDEDGKIVEGSVDIMAYDESGLDDLWDEIQSISQEFTSENTSINSTKLPAIFKLVNFESGTTNVDYGGGRFDNVAEYLAQVDVVNMVFDPYNRSAEHNKEVIELVKKIGGADTATCSNVLNVIKEPEVRRNVLQNISRLTKDGGKVYFTVYEGKGNGEEGPTKSGYQLNRKTADYLEEIQQVFPDATRKGKLIIATNGGSSVSGSCNIDMCDDIVGSNLMGTFDMADLINVADKTLDYNAGEVSAVLAPNSIIRSEHFNIYAFDVGTYVITLESSGHVVVYDLETGETLQVITSLREFSNFIKSINNGYDQMLAEQDGTYSLSAATKINADITMEPNLDPPAQNDPESLDPSEEIIELNLDCEITIDNDGGWEYSDPSYEWAKGPGSDGKWYSEDGVFIGDKESIVECVDDMLMTRLPLDPGTYQISGNVILVFNIDGITKYSSFDGLDEDGDPIVDESLDIDYADSGFNIQKSDIKNFKCDLKK